MKKKELRELLIKYENALITIAEGTSHARGIAEKALGIPSPRVGQFWEENLELRLKLEEYQREILKNLFDTAKNKKTVDERISRELDELLDNLLKKEKDLDEIIEPYKNPWNPSPYQPLPQDLIVTYEPSDNHLTKEEEDELKRCFPNNPTPWKIPSPDNIPPLTPPYGYPSVNDKIPLHVTGVDPDPGYYTASCSDDEEPIGPRKFA